MPTGLGFLEGISSGIEKGLGAYQQARKMRLDEERLQKEQALNEIKTQLEQKKLENEPSFQEKTTADYGKQGNLPEFEGKMVVGAKPIPGFQKPEDPYTAAIKQLTIQQKGMDIDKAKFEKTPQGRLEKSSGDVRQKLGFITSALQNVTNYENTYNEGGRQKYVNAQTPYIGGLIKSTPIDESRTNLEEAIGRLASGGAISTGEEQRFRRMIPTAADDEAASRRKLRQLRVEMENKLTGYGFKPEELGSMGFDTSKFGATGKGLIEPKISPEDEQALSWANANPKDPRAVAIKQRLGVQ